MPDTDIKQGANRLSIFRGVLEAIIIAALIWTGSTLVALRVENATLSGKLDAIADNTKDLPILRNDVITLKVQRLAQNDRDAAQDAEIKELRSLRGMK